MRRPRVILVGAGPGRADLVTVRGREWIEKADVIFYDRLLDPAMLRWAKSSCRKVFVGKERGRHAVEQDKVIRSMIEEATVGRCVVRLKGGDPLIFGRGGEEALALAEAGVPFEIVPGVTAALGVAAYAGVPLTHRGISSSVLLLTGQGASGRPHEPTIAVYMPAENLAGVVAGIIESGRAGRTPALAVQWGTWEKQRSVLSTLKGIVDAVRESGLGSPMLLIVGEVARFHERLDWYEGKPHPGWVPFLLRMAGAR